MLYLSKEAAQSQVRRGIISKSIQGQTSFLHIATLQKTGSSNAYQPNGQLAFVTSSGKGPKENKLAINLKSF